MSFSTTFRSSFKSIISRSNLSSRLSVSCANSNYGGGPATWIHLASRKSIVTFANNTSNHRIRNCAREVGTKRPKHAHTREWMYSRRRPFSAQQDATASSPMSPMKDPSHPYLYYHLFEAEVSGMSPVFALTLTEERPKHARSRNILGWLPAAAEGSEDESGLNDFVENASFIPLLHKGIQEGLHRDDIWKNYAIQMQSGWMHIFDQRNPPPLGRIPFPDDIIASVRVEDSVMLPDTYQAMPSYRLCTTDGVCLLSEGLMESLKTTIRSTASMEGRDN
ncbi:hypothetical protein SCHPADRAFT_849463 [Schizopora paradoxa]|uniref:Uncharacterized protein n=1 Tax=Schizopora paradoxa TaxID=27342 RepID=A0A0H2RVD5_9AGAM|nr:hypothetical protein SCHPADRAFT_849463 [Schizopora paradoxa]